MPRGGNRGGQRAAPVPVPLQPGEIVEIDKVELKGIPIDNTMGPINTLLVQTKVFGKPMDFGWFKDHTREGLSRQAIYKNNLIGVVMVKEEKNKKDGKYLYISAIATDPIVRGQGIGVKLINHVKAMYQQNKKQYSSIRLHVDVVNAPARGFYANRGFKQGQIITYLKAYEFVYIE